MREAAGAGAGLLNDVRALTRDGALAAAAEYWSTHLPDAHARRAGHHAGRAALCRCRD